MTFPGEDAIRLSELPPHGVGEGGSVVERGRVGDGSEEEDGSSGGGDEVDSEADWVQLRKLAETSRGGRKRRRLHGAGRHVVEEGGDEQRMKLNVN